MSDTENSPDDRFEEPPNVDPALVDLIGEAARLGDKSVIMAALEDLHPADASDALEQLEPELFGDVVALLGADLSSDILIELRNEYRNDAVDLLPDTSIAEALRALDSDDAAAILEGLSEGRRTDVLETLEAGDRTALERAMDFDEETAGRLMQREFVAAPEFWTVGHTVDHARASGDDLPDHFFEIYVVDPGFQVKGAVPLATLLRTPRDVRLAEIMNDIEAEITTDMDQEEVAFLFQKYHLASAPVVDEGRRITGMITVDDMVDVIQSENTEDLLALSGVSKADGSDTVWDSVKARAPWLGINLGTAFLASAIISIFEPALDRLVALAILMPVVAALGGNAGSQALTVAVRAIAEREMEGAATRRAVRREILTGIANGVIFAVGVGLVTMFWFRNAVLAFTIAVAILVTFTLGCLFGVLVPIVLKRLGADPAVASSVFVLTTTDIVAFASFLGLATLILIH